MKKWILPIALSIIVISPVVVYFTLKYTNSDSIVQNSGGIATIDYMSTEHKAMEIGNEFKIQSCHVVDGYIFSVLLENGEWINAHLPLATKPEATEVVIDLLKQSSVPSVILRRKLDSYWIVNFHLTLDGKEIILCDLLKERELIL